MQFAPISHTSFAKLPLLGLLPNKLRAVLVSSISYKDLQLSYMLKNLLRELESQGLTLRDAQKVLKREFGGVLGWKNVEKYKLLIYMDPRVPIMPPRGFMRDCSIVFGNIECVEQLALVLNEIAKYSSLNFVLNTLAKGKVKKVNASEEWYMLCQELLKTWFHEVSMNILLSRNM